MGTGEEGERKFGRRLVSARRPKGRGELERFHQADAVLSWRAGQPQAAINRRDIVLIRYVGAVQCDSEIVALPGELGIPDVARLDPVATRCVFEERRPLLGNVSKIDTRG